MAEDFKKLFIDGIPEKLFRRLKMLAAYKGITVKDLVISLIEVEVENHSDIV